MIKTILALSFLLLAHSWYPIECCSDSDCAPVPCQNIVEMANGTYEYAKMVFTSDKVKISLDAACHVCATITEDLKIPRCLFIVPTA